MLNTIKKYEKPENEFEIKINSILNTNRKLTEDEKNAVISLQSIYNDFKTEYQKNILKSFEALKKLLKEPDIEDSADTAEIYFEGLCYDSSVKVLNQIMEELDMDYDVVDGTLNILVPLDKADLICSKLKLAGEYCKIEKIHKK